MLNMLLFILLSFLPLSSWAIKGLYLPESELSPSVCKLIAFGVQDIYTPVNERRVPTGENAFIHKAAEEFYCSGTVIDNHHILTASHCYQGANEQNTKYGYMRFPVLVKTVNAQGQIEWVQPPGCSIDDLYKKGKEHCVVGERKVYIASKWDHVEAHCPILQDGKIKNETKNYMLKSEYGWANPRFSGNRTIYDVALMKSLEEITTTATPILTDKNELIETLKDNYMSCRAFGYGLDNDDKVGTLHGGQVPINYVAPDALMMITDAAGDEPQSGLTVAHTDHGDSGGALICKTKKGIDKLVGVISYGVEEPITPYNFDHYTKVDAYASIYYNFPWLQIAYQSNDRPQGQSGEDRAYYHSIAAKYEFIEALNLWNLSNECFKKKKNVLGDYYQASKEIISKTQDDIKLRKKQFEKKIINGLDARTYLHMDFQALEEFRNLCTSL